MNNFTFSTCILENVCKILVSWINPRVEVRVCWATLVAVAAHRQNAPRILEPHYQDALEPHYQAAPTAGLISIRIYDCSRVSDVSGLIYRKFHTQNLTVRFFRATFISSVHRDHFVYAPSQWETTL